MTIPLPAAVFLGWQFATQYAYINSPGTVDTSNALLHTIGLQ